MKCNSMPSLKLRNYLGARNKEGIQSQKDNCSEHKIVHKNLQEIGPHANLGKVVGIDPPF